MSQGIEYDIPTLQKLIRIPVAPVSAHWTLAHPRSASGEPGNDWGLVAVLQVLPEDAKRLCSQGRRSAVPSLPADWPFKASPALAHELNAFDFSRAVSLDSAEFAKPPLIPGWALCDEAHCRILLFLHTT